MQKKYSQRKTPHIVIVSHVVFSGTNEVYGPAHAISQYLDMKKINHSFIKHSLYNKYRSRIETKKHSRAQVRNSILPRNGIFSYFQYLWELMTTLHYVISNKKIDVLIAVDPLNAFAGIIGKKIGRIHTLIFYTADYAFLRFSNPILNSVYHLLDKVSYTFSDYVWNVSSRITSIRSQQGLPHDKNRFIPNAPILKTISVKKSSKIKHSLVLIANFTPAIKYDVLIYAIKKLSKTFPDIHLSFIGSGQREKAIMKLVKKNKLLKNVTFHGFQSHDKAIDILSQHEIGLALYDKKWPWTEFGDSLKAREYLALGLPVIINDHISTADDIRKFHAGYSIKVTETNLVKCITQLFSDTTALQKMQSNALRAARHYDLEKILNKELATLL